MCSQIYFKMVKDLYSNLDYSQIWLNIPRNIVSNFPSSMDGCHCGSKKNILEKTTAHNIGHNQCCACKWFKPYTLCKCKSNNEIYLDSVQV